MEIIARLGPFWTIGIVVNLALTALAVWWVLRSMRSRDPTQASSSQAGEKPRRDN